MGNNPRPVNSISFLKLLPGLYSEETEDGGSLLRDFLAQFEEMFAGLQASIAGDGLKLTYRDAGSDGSESAGYPLVVDLFNAGRLGYPKDSLVYIPGKNETTFLAEAIEANREDIDVVRVTDSSFRESLRDGDKFVVLTSSGLAGLTAIHETPPLAFLNRGEADKLAYLQYLASWVGLPVRSDQLVSWNRRFLREAMVLDNDPSTQRSTLPGLRAILNAWHKGEIVAEETIVTDLIAPENGVDTVFRLGESRIGVDTLLGQEQEGRFQVYLTADPNDVSMRDPKKLDAMIAAARLILDMEKPVNTEYTLHISVNTMQIAPDAPIAPDENIKRNWRGLIDKEEEPLTLKDTNTYARIGLTTLLRD